MQTITLRGKVGADGVLHLQVPHLPIDQEMDAVVQLQPHLNGQSKEWIDELYGSCADDPIERPDQGQWEEREGLL